MLQISWHLLIDNGDRKTKQSNITNYSRTVKNVKQINAPLIPGAMELIEKIGVKTSPFILGQLPEDYSENTLVNKSDKLRKVFNKNLRFLTEKLNLSVPLTLETARDCYATCLKRSGKPIESSRNASFYARPISVSVNRRSIQWTYHSSHVTIIWPQHKRMDK